VRAGAERIRCLRLLLASKEKQERDQKCAILLIAGTKASKSFQGGGNGAVDSKKGKIQQEKSRARNIDK